MLKITIYLTSCTKITKTETEIKINKNYIDIKRTKKKWPKKTKQI